MARYSFRPKHTTETKLKMSLAAKGKTKSPAHCLAISIAKKQNPTRYWLGKKRPDFVGENNHKWVADRTKIVGRHTRSFHDGEYKQWRLNVKNRDGWKCRISNDSCSGRVEVHHILGWRDHPELRYQPNNGITLCHFHHPRKRDEEKKLSPYFKQLVAALD